MCFYSSRFALRCATSPPQISKHATVMSTAISCHVLMISHTLRPFARESKVFYNSLKGLSTPRAPPPSSGRALVCIPYRTYTQQASTTRIQTSDFPETMSTMTADGDLPASTDRLFEKFEKDFPETWRKDKWYLAAVRILRRSLKGFLLKLIYHLDWSAYRQQ